MTATVTPIRSDTRPTIQPRIGALHDAVAEAIRALVRDVDVYQREGYLVRVTHTDAEETADGVTWELGSAQIRPIAPPTLRLCLTRSAKWVRFDARAKELLSSQPPADVVNAVHAHGEYPGIRPLIGIIETPSLRPDGTLLTERGYDAMTGYLYEPSGRYPTIAPMPTRADAQAAYAALRAVFCDFPFALDIGADVAIAAILSIVARPMITGAVPLFAFDASTRGSGKSLLADVVAMIATGRCAPRLNWPTQEEELDKCLGAVAIRGSALVNLDNVARPLGGATLDRCLTATDRVDLRVLGRSELLSLRWRAVVLASGNNLIIAGDTTRRVLLSRLEPPQEDPENRTDFRHPNLLAHVAIERPKLVAAALTMLRAWWCAGGPEPRTWGSFEAWAAAIPSAIAFAGGGDVLLARPSRDEGHDLEASALITLMAAIGRLDVDKRGVRTRDLVAVLYPRRERGEAAPPDGLDDARDAVETLARCKPGAQPTAVQIGHMLRGQRGRYLAGHRLMSRTCHANVVTWSVV